MKYHLTFGMIACFLILQVAGLNAQSPASGYHLLKKVVLGGEDAIRRDREPGTAAMLFLGLIQPSIIVWHFSAGTYDMTKQAEAVWPMFCGTIRS